MRQVLLTRRAGLDRRRGCLLRPRGVSPPPRIGRRTLAHRSSRGRRELPSRGGVPRSLGARRPCALRCGCVRPRQCRRRGDASGDPDSPARATRGPDGLGPGARAPSKRGTGEARGDRRWRRARPQAVAGRGAARGAGALPVASETQDRITLLESTIANLQIALALDPSNDDAKFNLELALQRGRGIQLSEGAGGARPSPGGAGAKGAGAGDPGSGY